MIEVKKRVEDENKIVQKVVIMLNGSMELTFERINDKPKETSRTIPGDRLYDNSKLWITPADYKKLMRTVYAIFTHKCTCGGKCGANCQCQRKVK